MGNIDVGDLDEACSDHIGVVELIMKYAKGPTLVTVGDND